MDVHPWASLCVHYPLCIVLERLFIQPTSPVLWGKAGANFIINADQRAISAEIALLAILDMDRVGEGKLEMITTSCRSDQVEVGPWDALSTLFQ